MITESSAPRRRVLTPAYRSGVIVAVGQPAIFALQLAINVLLARFLTPLDFGLVVMVTAITNFAMIFRDLGLGTVTVQREDLTNQQASNLFWLNSFFGLALAVAVCALAWPLGLIYQDNRIVAITLVTSVAFLATGISVQYAALLRREMRFGALVATDVASLAASGIVAVTTALVTRSYWSIVIFNISRPVFYLAGLAVANPWRPAMFVRGHRTKGLLRRGMNIAGFDMINYWSRNLDNIFVGHFLGATVLGIYKKGYELLLLPISQMRAPITSVSLPALSRYQNMPEKLATLFLDMVSAVALLTSAVVGSMLLIDEWLVPVVLGQQWEPIIGVFNYLSIAACIQSVVGLLGLLLITTDHTKRYFTWGVWHSALMVLSFVVGIRWGLWSMIGCYVAANVLALLPSIWYCTRPTPVPAGDVIRRAAIPNLACWGAFCIAVLVKQMLLDAGRSVAVACTVAALIHAICIGAHVATSPRQYEMLMMFRRVLPASLSARWFRSLRLIAAIRPFSK
jgi:PST family polysaccharide transporter